MIAIDSDVKASEDFLEFFGEEREAILKDVLAVNDENEIKSELFPICDISHQKLYDIYKNEKYYILQSRQVSDNWFQAIQAMGENIIFKSAKDFVKKSIKQTKVLDYGCGHGTYGLHMALCGYDVTLADIPHKHFLFLKFLCKKYNIPVKFYDIPCSNSLAFDEKYDFIINSEVMEHCDDPAIVLRSLVDAMNDKSVMYMSVFFDNAGGRDPSHLLKNMKRFNLSWTQFVKETGLLEVIFRDSNNVEKVYRKI